MHTLTIDTSRASGAPCSQTASTPADRERARRDALADLGLTRRLDKIFRRLRRDDWTPARVVVDHGARWLVDAGWGPTPATARAALTRDAPGDRPAVGDWVAISTADGSLAVIEALLPRERALVRKAAGERTVPQVIAAWIDTAFVVCGLDGDFNPRRIERVLTAVTGSGAQPVVLLNKADLCADREAARAALQTTAPVCFVSAATGEGLDVVAALLGRGRTGVLVGSSGVGKSSLTNRLLGREAQAVSSVRADDSKGRHTTTARALMVLPDGAGVLIDTPGVRELALWAGEADADEAFADIAQIASGCRFRDCGHQGEPGCAVGAAIAGGALDRDRFAAYTKLQRELAYAERQQDAAAARNERARWKSVTTRMRVRRRFENRNGGKGW